MRSSFQVMWDQNELISKPAERDLWWQFVEGLQTIMVPVRHVNGGAGKQMSTIPWNPGGTSSYATSLSNSSSKTLTHGGPQGCAQKPREQKERKKKKKDSCLLQLLLREPSLPACAVIG